MTKLERIKELLDLYDLPAVLHGGPYSASIYILRNGYDWETLFNYVDFEASKHNVPNWLSDKIISWIGFYDPEKIIPKHMIYSEQEPCISWIKL